MKSNKIYGLIILLNIIFLFSSCIEDFIIDPQEGPQLVGISGNITNEYKKHQLVISKSTDFYSDEEAEMISDAEVFVYDGFDTIYYEETEQKGYYETRDSVAGVIGRCYNLSVNIIDEEGLHNYYSQSIMPENTPQIDSACIKEIMFGDMAMMKMTGLLAYFQSVENPETTYLVNVAINDSLLENSLIKCQSFFLAGLSGMYVNGDEMVELVGEQPVYYFPSMATYDPETGDYILINFFDFGDKISLYLYSITPEFSKYISDVNSSFGSNPMMGMPHNVRTNIYPEGKAIGFFEATSVVETSFIY